MADPVLDPLTPDPAAELRRAVDAVAADLAAGCPDPDPTSPTVPRAVYEAACRDRMALRAERDAARLRLLSAAGDDLCRLTQDEIKAYTSGAVPIPPEDEFIASCRRFHAQVAVQAGVNHDCLTLAQLVAENERLRQAEADAADERAAKNRVMEAVLSALADAPLPGDSADVQRVDWTPAHLAERFRLIAAERDATRKNLGNLLAVIFGDGGHRQAEIGDDAKAVGEALAIWYAAKADRDAAREALAEFFALPNWQNRCGPWKDVNDGLRKLAALAGLRKLAALAPRGGG